MPFSPASFFALIIFLCFAEARALTVADLQGGWTTRGLAPGAGCSGLMSEVHAAPFVEIENWQIAGDSLHVFRYPCQYFGSQKILVRGDSLYMREQQAASCRVEFERGWLKLTWRSCREQYFKRDTFELRTLGQLRRDSVNYDCLAGTMQLVTHYAPPDEAAFDEKFPVAMPKHVLISKTLARKIFTQKKITLKIAGTSRLFYVERVEWDNLVGGYPERGNDKWKGQPVILIYPAEWWKGELFNARYKMIAQ